MRGQASTSQRKAPLPAPPLSETTPRRPSTLCRGGGLLFNPARHLASVVVARPPDPLRLVPLPGTRLCPRECRAGSELAARLGRAGRGSALALGRSRRRGSAPPDSVAAAQRRVHCMEKSVLEQQKEASQRERESGQPDSRGAPVLHLVAHAARALVPLLSISRRPQPEMNCTLRLRGDSYVRTKEEGEGNLKRARQASSTQPHPRDLDPDPQAALKRSFHPSSLPLPRSLADLASSSPTLRTRVEAA